MADETTRESASDSDSECLDSRLEEYLIDRVEDGDQYFKSRFIAGDLGLSAKKIGHLMREIQSRSTILEISDWGGNSDAITWYIKISREDRSSPYQR
jgi:hypothetical protein